MEVAESGVGDRHLGERAGVLGLVQRPGQGADRLVDPRLIGVFEGHHGGPAIRRYMGRFRS